MRACSGGCTSLAFRVGVAAEAGVSVDLEGRDITESFDTCGPRGCMAEAELAVGAEVATTLWMGRPITMRLIEGSEREPMTGMLPAHGFRAGLKELIRLRRHEGRALARRGG